MFSVVVTVVIRSRQTQGGGPSVTAETWEDQGKKDLKRETERGFMVSEDVGEDIFLSSESLQQPAVPNPGEMS